MKKPTIVNELIKSTNKLCFSKETKKPNTLFNPTPYLITKIPCCVSYINLKFRKIKTHRTL